MTNTKRYLQLHEYIYSSIVWGIGSIGNGIASNIVITTHRFMIKTFFYLTWYTLHDYYHYMIHGLSIYKYITYMVYYIHKPCTLIWCCEVMHCNVSMLIGYDYTHV